MVAHSELNEDLNYRILEDIDTRKPGERVSIIIDVVKEMLKTEEVNVIYEYLGFLTCPVGERSVAELEMLAKVYEKLIESKIF